MTNPGRTSGESGPRRQADRPLVPDPRLGDKNMREIEDPYELPFPDRWPHRLLSGAQDSGAGGFWRH